MFQSCSTVVGDVVKPGNAVIGPGVNVTYGEHPVLKVPVKRPHNSWAIPWPSSSLGGLSLLPKTFTVLEPTADDMPVRTQVAGFLPVARLAAIKWSAAAQKSGLASAGCQGKFTPVAGARW